MAKKTESKTSKTGNGVEELKERNIFVEMLLVSLEMYLFTGIFSLFGVVFTMLGANLAILKVILGVLFIAPVLMMEFTKGRNLGEKNYKLKNRGILIDPHEKTVFKVSIFKSLIYPIPFVVLSLGLALLAQLCDVVMIQGIMTYVFVPTCLIYSGFGILKMNGVISWFHFLSVSTMVVAIYIAFIIGYVYAVKKQERRTNDVINEIRSFE